DPHGYRKEIGKLDGSKDSFLTRLAEFHDLYVRWTEGKARKGTEADRNLENKRLLDFVRQSKTFLMSWSMMDVIWRHGYGSDKLLAAFADILVSDVFQASGYAVRYEHARALLSSGKTVEAQAAYKKLYQETLAKGSLPLIDTDFHRAFTQ